MACADRGERARADFVTLTAFGGWLWPDARHIFWDGSVTTWTHCTIDRYAVLALEYAEVSAEVRAHQDTVDIQKPPTS